jgi:hypothetical protein
MGGGDRAGRSSDRRRLSVRPSGKKPPHRLDDAAYHYGHRLEGIHTMRRDEPNRHGRAADALIASYLRELLAEDQPDAPHDPVPAAPGEPSVTALASAPDAVAPRLEATL